MLICEETVECKRLWGPVSQQPQLGLCNVALYVHAKCISDAFGLLFRNCAWQLTAAPWYKSLLHAAAWTHLHSMQMSSGFLQAFAWQ